MRTTVAIQIHLMLIFIRKDDIQPDGHPAFKYISC